MVDNNFSTSNSDKYNNFFSSAATISSDEQADSSAIREQDRLLPIANVGRIMKQILPPNAKISKEAKETMQECVSEFISFVTGEASDRCHKEKRKTVNGDDICWALATLGFDNYADPLRSYLNRYREIEGERAAANNNGNNSNKASSSSNHHHPNNSNYGGDQYEESSSPTLLKFNVIEKDDNGSLSRRY